MVGFEQCAAIYFANNSLSDEYGWTGPVVNIAANRSRQITWQGCEELCGATMSRPDYYAWPQIATTMTTWVLPVIGVLIQAPWESNALVATLFAVARWLGSPVASLSYILWNIKNTGNCARLVDLADTIDPPLDEEHLRSIRDSFYLLTTMNQFKIKPALLQMREAEGLLRIVLFSKDLKAPDGTSLDDSRARAAKTLRENRKRGVVPVMISIGWFIFALGISIQSAFALLGDHATAHDLALGLLLAWLPVLVLACVVDRNFNVISHAKDVLNNLVNPVCESLQNDQIRNTYLATFDYFEEEEELTMKHWVNRISKCSGQMTNFFTEFAGQGRRRFHYGAAHPILSSIEVNFLKEEGWARGWLHDERNVRYNLVLGEPESVLLWFDIRQIWQILVSSTIVLGSILGAFILSYYTPTVGLGCRSGGYMIFAINVVFLVFAEMFIWALTTPPPPEMPNMDTRIRTRQYSVVSLARGLRNKIQRTWDRETLQSYADLWLLKPCEAINAVWLIYIVMAQTVGSYNTCRCLSSLWAGKGGYFDFILYKKAEISQVEPYWIGGTTISASVMAFTMVYLVAEWLLQSHLSTEDPVEAARGLKRCRQFRRAMYPFSSVLHSTVDGLVMLTHHCLKLFGIDSRTNRRNLSWRYKDTLPPIRRREQRSSTPRDAVMLVVKQNWMSYGKSTGRSMAQDDSEFHVFG